MFLIFLVPGDEHSCALICLPCLKSGGSGTLLVVFKYLPTTVASLVVIAATEKERVPCMNKCARNNWCESYSSELSYLPKTAVL